MADILRVTTPLVNKNQSVEPRQNVGISTPFPMQDPSRVTQPNRQSPLLQQNNGMTQEETSALLLKLLKDPSVTVNFLQSISSMEAMIKLLPMNNTPFTQEIEQMFAQLLVPSDQIAQEMQRQEGGTTLFKGELFDLIREALRANPEQKELRQAAVNFLKALTLSLSRQETLGSVENGLQYLSESIAPSKTLAGKLAELAEQFRQPEAQERFGELSRQALDLLAEVEESILFSDKTDKAVRMVIYNLSRYNGNEDFLRQAVSRMLTQLRGDAARNQFLQAVQQYLQNPERPKGSTVMEALGRILQRAGRQSGADGTERGQGGKDYPQPALLALQLHAAIAFCTAGAVPGSALLCRDLDQPQRRRGRQHPAGSPRRDDPHAAGIRYGTHRPV